MAYEMRIGDWIADVVSSVLAVWSFLFFGATFVVAGVVRSTGAVVPPLLILGFALWVVRVPFASWLQPALGVEATWWSFPASAFVRSEERRVGQGCFGMVRVRWSPTN